jgi:acyl-CoA thioester hydrolase
MPAEDRTCPEPRTAYRVFRSLPTRWMDNDVYGHVNNVVYYSFFDTAVNGYLIDAGVLDIHRNAWIGLVVETRCSYFAPIEFPQVVEAGLRVAHLGRSSVRYEVALFLKGQPQSVAGGHFVHVYVDRAERRPVVGLPDALVHALGPLRSDCARGRTSEGEVDECED